LVQSTDLHATTTQRRIAAMHPGGTGTTTGDGRAPHQGRGLGANFGGKPLQFLAGTNTQFGVQDAAGTCEGAQSVGPPGAAIQREHQVAPQCFPQRIGEQLGFDSVDQRQAFAVQQGGLEVRVDGIDAQRFQPVSLRGREVQMSKLSERFAPP
jgi:hypothetical protein